MALSSNKEKRERQLANLKPCKKGDPSPNPSGRPKKLPITDALREFFSDPENVRLYVETAVKHARNGSASHFKEINDRAEGSVAQKHLHGGEDGGPIELEIRIVKTDARKNKGAD